MANVILDQFGNPFESRRFARAINRDPYRGLLTNQAQKGINELIPSGDRRALAALSRRMVFNVGVPKECVRQKATYSVGAAWRPVYHGDDTKRGKRAGEWLEGEWFYRCNVRGGSEWWDDLELVSKCMDRDGESFVLMVRDEETGWPYLQHIPAHLVRSEVGLEVVKGGAYDGATIEDGVIFDGAQKPVAYRVYDGDGKDFRDIAAGSIIHSFDRDCPEQLRGYPAFSASLYDLVHSLESKELELLRQIVISNIYLLEKGGPVPDPNDPTWESVIDTTNSEAVLYESVSPGVKHLKAGADIEAVTHTNPGSVWQDFQTRIHREAVVGMGWSYSLVRISDGPMQGTAERAEVVRAREAVKTRQRALKRFARRAVTWALDTAKDGGHIGSVPGSMLWSFSTPARLTVDDGREDRCQLESVLKGAQSLTQWLANQGRTPREHFLTMARERALAAKVAEEITDEEGVTITAEELLPAREAGELQEIVLEDD